MKMPTATSLRPNGNLTEIVPADLRKAAARAFRRSGLAGLRGLGASRGLRGSKSDRHSPVFLHGRFWNCDRDPVDDAG